MGWLKRIAAFGSRGGVEPEPNVHHSTDKAAASEPRIRTKWLDQTFAEISSDGRTMKFATTGSSSVKRVKSLFTKEPVTLAWIDTFEQGETLFDIGANVGMYTIYAAVVRGAHVYAFEPEALNYAELNKNIFLNGLHGQAMAYCVALSDCDKLDRLLLSDFGLGISYHDFGENSWTEDKVFAPDWKVSKDNRLQQGCVGRRLDSLIGDGLPVPDHIKIDVDGLEHRIVDGMMETLRHPNLKTVLVEINFDNTKNLQVIEIMQNLGWKFSWDQIGINRSAKFSVEKIKKYQEKGQGGLNYIFYKSDFYEEFFKRVFRAYSPGEAIDVGTALEGLR